MLITIHTNSILNFAGSLIILIFAVYSIIYINSFRTHRIVLDFSFLQLSLFIFMFGNAMYINGSTVSDVLFWTKICYIGAASVIVTSYRFSETVIQKRNKILSRSLEVICLIVLISIILPGDHYFIKELNPVKTYSSVIKGSYFPIFIIINLSLVAYSLIFLSKFILTDVVARKIGSPLIIGYLLWFTTTAFDGIFAAILSWTKPNLWIGPTIMAFTFAIFIVKWAEHRHNEMERVKVEKEIIYNNLIHDKVTNLFTREYIYESLNQRISQIGRNGRNDSLLFIDIDNFKMLNDEFGHKKGDEILKLIGQIFHENIRQEDIPARFGGDEFLILLDDCEDPGAIQVAENIQGLFAKAIQKTFPDRDYSGKVTLSIGIVSSDYWRGNPEEIIHKADLAMYISKKKGKNMISLYTENIERPKTEGNYAVEKR